MHKNKLNNYLIILFFIYLFFSFLIYKDYGISIDEPSTRFHGLVSFNYIVGLLNKFLFFNFAINENLPNLQSYEHRDYGVFFEIIAITIERIFKLSNFSEIFYLRHLITNIFFIISSLFFAKVIFKFTKDLNFSLWGSIILYTTPRIFANSFYNNKDLIFLSFFIICIYYIFSFFKKKNTKNLVLVSLSLAILTSIRVIGIYLLILLLIFLLIEIFEKKKNKSSFFDFLKIIILYFLFIYFFWPLLWESPLNNFLYSFKNMINYPWGGSVFYLGEYHKGAYLPWHYLLVWIIASNPTGIIIIFLISFFFVAYRLVKRLLKIEEENYSNSLWKNESELFSYLNFAIIFSPIFLIIINSSTIYSGWRHVYFVYPSIILLVIYFLNLVNKSLFKLKYKNIMNIILVSFLVINLHSLIRYHPYQNVFFNKVFDNYANKLFEIDYWGLSNVDALKQLIKEEDIVNVCNLGLMDLTFSKKMLNEEESKKIMIQGQDFDKCSHIISNKIYVYNPKFTKKYQHPDNFKISKQIKRGNIVINELLERN